MPAFDDTLAVLFTELVDGPPPDAAYMLNPGDPGLLRSLDKLTAEAASATPPDGGASIAAHVDHLLYGLDLMLRWSGGESDPWSSADWKASWKRGTVDDLAWSDLRARLRSAAMRWKAALLTRRELSAVELNGVAASVAHLAYHFGAIRQIDRSIGGPQA